MAYWWVNQGNTYKTSRDLGILWAPVRRLIHWDRMLELKPGDVVVHYAGGHVRAIGRVIAPARDWTKPSAFPGSWDGRGRMAVVEYKELAAPMALVSIPEKLRLQQGGPGPFDKNLAVKVGYLWPIDQPLLRAIEVDSGFAPSSSDEQPPVPGGQSYSGDLDIPASVIQRGEQAALRSFLFGSATLAECALCGATFPVAYLRAAHIKPRYACIDSERRDFEHIAMPACLFGCDALFEFGAVYVDDDGLIQAAGSLSSSADSRRQLIVGRVCKAYAQGSAAYFAWHRKTALGEVISDEAKNSLLLS